MAEEHLLFDPNELSPIGAKASGPTFRPLKYPLWTEYKAALIAQYLYYFVMITKHGTYIDGFAGSQNNHAGMWAAKRVLESKPRWLRNFHLVELDGNKIAGLQALKAAEDAVPSKPKRSIEVYQGDFNTKVDSILSAGSIKPTEATFCLLDQRTFECHWKSLEKLASYNPAREHKIELFYFLPIGWLDRAFAATKDKTLIANWWGRPDWRRLHSLNKRQRADVFVDRIKAELSYASVVPWPIYEKQGSNRMMYFMIHATDHPEAPMLMRRAYSRAVDPIEPMEQLRFAWEDDDIES